MALALAAVALPGVRPSPAEAAPAPAGAAVISDDGRVVAFVSGAPDLVPGDTNGVEDVFVHDRSTGATTRVSTAADGTQADGPSGGRLRCSLSEPTCQYEPRPDRRSVAVSDDGRFVAFLSAATNLAPGSSSGLADVYVKDLGAGTVERVSSAPGGAAADGHAFALTIGGDGSTVAFWSRATNLVEGDTNGEDDLFVHHRATDSTQRANIGADGAVTDESLCAFSFDSEFCRRFSHDEAPSLSDDGRVLAFSSLDGEDFGSIVVRDLVAGASTTVTDPTVAFEATAPWVSGDGRFVSYRSGHIVTPGGHILDPVRDGRYVYDREHGRTHEVLPGNALGYDPAVSADRTLRASPTPPYARPRDPARLRLRHRINAGGPEVVTAINTWDADRGFVGGDLLTTARPVEDPAGNGAVYSDARTGIFSYVLPVPDGRYRVRLLFAELRRCCGPFGRVFDVAAEGRVVVDDASLLALSAGQFEQLTIKVPIRVEAFVTVADGVLDLTFTRVVHRPLLSGIEVIDAR